LIEFVEFSEEIVERGCGVEHQFVIYVEERFDTFRVCCRSRSVTVSQMCDEVSEVAAVRSQT
jgi:hypothetical protein